MPPARHRGRRSAPEPQIQSKAEQEIRALQAERNQILVDLDEKLTELAVKISEHMQDGVGTAEVGTWLTSEDRPNGVSRQQVYKLVRERVDGIPLNRDYTKKNRPAPSNKASAKPLPKPSRSRPILSSDDRRGGPRQRPRPKRTS